jgi:hypothetical protein
VKSIVLFLQKRLLFEIPCSIFDIQNPKQAKAARLKGEGFEPGEWKNKESTPGERGFQDVAQPGWVQSGCLRA